ncbi:N-acetyltransferase family protein [Enterococcus sp. AZ072]|uniref:GNAT family N-acetyltransferase n=1 Tax=unclassified Enterococcus TaxID=2608891 RepID=UPI003D2A903D
MIRFAEKQDGPAIAELILVILKDMELPFVEDFGEAATKEAIITAYDDPTYRFGYQRGLVAEVDGKIAGAAFGYPAKDEPIIDRPLKKYLVSKGLPEDIEMFIDSEAFPNEWYLDSIAVDEAFRGQGIGSSLLEAVDLIAIRDDEEIVGLSVDRLNPGAKKLYLREGFEEVGQHTISGHLYDHMQRKIKTAVREKVSC